MCELDVRLVVAAPVVGLARDVAACADTHVEGEMQAVPLVIATPPVLTSKAPFEGEFLVTPEQPTPNKARQINRS